MHSHNSKTKNKNHVKLDGGSDKIFATFQKLTVKKMRNNNLNKMRKYTVLASKNALLVNFRETNGK